VNRFLSEARVRLWIGVTGLTLSLLPGLAAREEATIEIRDYAAMPMTGSVDGTQQWNRLLARINTLREEPGGATRLFVNDLNGPLYILDKDTGTLTTYLDFNGRDERPGIFHRLVYETGSGNGLSSFQFDPDFARNGLFYTVHIENPALPGSNLPDRANVPGFDTTGYTATSAILTPGPALHEAVVIEWTDTDTANSTFEGTARELLRVQMNTRIHPMGEVNFNPTARPGDSDWRILYIGCGDSGAGESRTSIRSNPQRLDNLVGKILRIVPDLNEHVRTSAVSDNGRYRIPRDNPFVALSGARKEIWAYGLRNPYRLNWAVDPVNPRNTRLIATSVGLATWETVHIIHAGANYGYSYREGNELLQPDNKTTRLPAVDEIPMQIGEHVTATSLVPNYPVIQYGHVPGGGDAIGSGYLYTGTALPSLRGKYVFTDLTTGRVWYADYHDMVAADDGDATTQAPLHEVKILWNGRTHDTLFPIAEAGYKARGGTDPDLPGVGRVSESGRVDGRFAVDAAGELYIMSKSDAMIRAVVGATGF
jgi:hypothetical protein